MKTRDDLPNDTVELKGLVRQLLHVVEEQKLLIANQNERIETQSQQITTQSKQLEEQSQRIDQLTDQLGALKRHRFGKKSEKVKEEQEETTSQEESKSSQDGYVLKKGHGRNHLPANLPRRKVYYQIKASERMCDCCGSFLSQIGQQVSEQLEIVPAKVYVVQHIRHKYACKKCQDKVVMAEMPAQPIDKGKAGPGVLADVIVNKYKDHLPLYRQSQRFNRFGVPLHRSTLCSWVMQSAFLLKPLVEAMTERDLIPSGHLFSDDTPIRTLNCDNGNTKTGRFWIYTSKGSNKHPACTVYKYTETRQAEGPLEFLKNFEGYFQADAYTGYDSLFANKNKKEVREVACWAHARRKFYEIVQLSKKEGLAHEGLRFIQALYKIESEAKDRGLSECQIRKWRQTHAPPTLKAFHTWLIEQQKRVLPRTNIGGAIQYTLNHWEALNTYLLDGKLEIDNNRSERGIRPLAVGRKNYLFMGSPGGGEAAAIIYSLLATCAQHGVNPWDYLKDVLARIPAHPNSKIEELLPYRWEKSTTEVSSEELLQQAA